MRTSTRATVRRVDVGAIDDFKVGIFSVHVIDNREIGVVRLNDGTMRAVLNACPHRGAPICLGTVGGTWPPCAPGDLDFDLAGRVLVCPWHGLEFDLQTGRELFHARPYRLRLFDTTVEQGRVWVHV